MSQRYAVYFAPAPKTPLWRFGSEAVGYDAALGRAVASLPPVGIAAEDWSRWTEAPRRYGFHATLKAPFRLAEGLAEPDLLDAVAAFAGRQAPVAVPELAVRLVGGFVALVPAEPHAGLEALAAACVTGLEGLRAPLDADDRARRRPDRLSPREVELLERYGYPHVLERFRFHMTLTGSLPAEAREPVRAALEARYAMLAPGAAIDALTVFAQPAPEASFRILARFPLAGL